MLGWEEIDAVVMDDDIRACRLWEISENLHRAELSVLERAKLVKEWVEMTKDDQPPQVGAAKPQYEQRGVRLAARQLPVDGDTDKAREHRIARDLKIASLSPEAQDVANKVKLDDNQSALLEAAKEQTPEAQGKVQAPGREHPGTGRQNQ